MHVTNDGHKTLCGRSAHDEPRITSARAAMLHWQHRLGSIVDCVKCCVELRRRETEEATA